MKYLTLLYFSLISISVSAQKAPKKLLKMIDFDVLEMEAEAAYPLVEIHDSLTYHKSLSKKGDTTGVSSKTEFLMFRDDVTEMKGEEFKLLKLDFVSNWEYQQFANWVQDSLFREIIYLNQNRTGDNEIDEYTVAQFLDYQEEYYDDVLKEQKEFDISQPFINRELFNFNWDFNWQKKIKYYQYYPEISQFIYWPNQRLHKVRDWDLRKYVFDYDRRVKNDEILISADRDAWAERSERPFDLYYNMANYYWIDEGFEAYPITGLLGTQIQAFLKWEEQRLQRKIDKKDGPYKVKLSLPTLKELEEYDTGYCGCHKVWTTPEIDMTEQWQITNQEYWEFMLWVQDSVIQEVVYMNSPSRSDFYIDEEDIGDMLAYNDIYYDDVNLTWTEFDPSQPFINRGLFHFNEDYDWKKKIPAYKWIHHINFLFEDPANDIDTINATYDPKKFAKKNYIYQYEWYDFKRSAKVGDIVVNDTPNYKMRKIKDIWDTRELDFGDGVRRHKNIAYFIMEEQVMLYPGYDCEDCEQYEKKKPLCPNCKNADAKLNTYDFWSDPEGLVKGLNYLQAKAFYHWKYVRNLRWIKTDDRIHTAHMPSEEEFKKAQKGEKMVLKEDKLYFPSPWFRYVIHVYPKK